MKSSPKSGVPGRQPGMKGHGRKVELAVTGEEKHLPTKCCVCDGELNPDLFVAWTAFYVLDLVAKAAGLAGLEVTHVKHIYGEIVCSCGHVNRSEPGIACSDAGWKIKLSEWHLVGPTLATHDCMFTPLPAQHQERHSTIFLMNGSTFI